MIIFVNDNSGFLFLRYVELAQQIITEIINRISAVTIILNKESAINGD
jgi:hypothetical protein